jgi:hypothetical protein
VIQVGEAADHGSTLPVVEDGGMQGYDSSSYGDAFADVYDDWYRDISDIDATVDCVAALARSGRVLELGVGTGRLALPLAARGCTVTGIDSSARMLEHLALNDPDRAVTICPRGPSTWPWWRTTRCSTCSTPPGRPTASPVWPMCSTPTA